MKDTLLVLTDALCTLNSQLGIYWSVAPKRTRRNNVESVFSWEGVSTFSDYWPLKSKFILMRHCALPLFHRFPGLQPTCTAPNSFEVHSPRTGIMSVREYSCTQ